MRYADQRLTCAGLSKSVLHSDLSLTRCGELGMMPLLQGLGTGLALLVLDLGIFYFEANIAPAYFMNQHLVR